MMKKDLNFENLLKRSPNFKVRRAVERLREGLFDPLGVKLLTTHDTPLNKHFATQVKNLERGKPAHLCLCGAYGQGKSHTLNYIRQRALEENYAVSYINLDPREIPFHNLKNLYRALMENLTFPGDNKSVSKNCSNIAEMGTAPDLTVDDNIAPGLSLNNRETSTADTPTPDPLILNGNSTFVDIWKKKARHWLSLPENRDKSLEDMIPESIPHRFKSILTAMAQQTLTIPHKKRHLKKHSKFKPREFPWVLNNAFLGKEIPVFKLRNALKYRQVSFYNEETLVCRDDRLYLKALQGYAALFQNMGYKGWMVLFDEAESIMLARINQRSKSYSILHDLFCPDRPAKGFLPVFAFTHDFFTHLKDEDFERTRIIRKRKIKMEETPPAEDSEQSTAIVREPFQEEKEVPSFENNYSKAWQDIHIHHLRDLTSREWKILVGKLIQIHALAYQWEPDVKAMEKMITFRLSKQSDDESRMKLKLIVNLLDLEQQQRVISAYC